MNKAFVWIPLAFVLGGLVGYWGPSEELRRAREKAAEEKARPAKAANGFDSFAKIVNIPESADPGMMHRRERRRAAERQRAAAKRLETPPQAEDAQPLAASGAEAAPSADAVAAEPRQERQATSPDDLRARMEEAAELWRLRADVARAKAVEKLGLDEAGEAKFNDAIDAMNARLRDSMQTMAELIDEQDRLTPELGVRLMGDLSTAVAETYDAIGESAAADMRGEVSDLSLIDFIDPMVGEPLIAVQGKIDGAFGGSGGNRK